MIGCDGAGEKSDDDIVAGSSNNHWSVVKAAAVAATKYTLCSQQSNPLLYVNHSTSDCLLLPDRRSTGCESSERVWSLLYKSTALSIPDPGPMPTEQVA